MNRLFSWNCWVLSALCALSLSVAALPAAWATDLPSGVLTYLKQKDPQVKVRFDGLVLFSNGETYVPVIPQDPALSVEAQQVIMTLPEQAAFPDLIEFDNHFFLMRLIQTASGRLTFPKMTEYPLQLREGLLPQDFVLPNNLFIPVELKVILGALPYNPDYTPAKQPVMVSPRVALASVPADKRPAAAPHVTYVFDLDGQKILSIDPLTGRKLGDLTLDCAPASLRVSPNGKQLFVPCLSTNELVVVDTGSNLVKTRIPVGQRPDRVLYLERSQEVAVSHRYSPFVSLINGVELLPGYKVDLPGNSGAMAVVPGGASPQMLVADAFKPQVYLIDLNTRTVQRTIATLPDISTIRVLQGKQGPELWVASRTKHQVQALDLATGTPIKTFEVGTKPLEFAVFGNRLYVVSAGKGRLDVIDWPARAALEPTDLGEQNFPTEIAVVPSEERAYVTMAGNTSLAVINLSNGQVENTLPVEFRASMIAMTPDAGEHQTAVTQNSAEKLAPLEPEAAATEPDQAAPGSVSPAENPRPDQPAPKKERKTGGFKLFGKKTEAPATARQETPASESNAAAIEPPVTATPTFTQSSPLSRTGGGKFSLKLGRDQSPKKSPADPATIAPADAVAPATAKFTGRNPQDPPEMLEESGSE